MAVTDYFQKVARSTATTLSSPGYTIADTSITVGSTTNWPSTGVTFAIDTVTTAGVRVDGTYNVFRGTVASATSITNVVYVGGDANQNYSAGATTRVYILVSSYQHNRLVDGLLIDHSQEGAHEIATNFDPSNVTLETQKWVGVASAVNEVTVTNAATGNPVIISATGGDTNIGITLTPKGTGLVELPDNTIKTADITDSAVTTAKILDANVTTAKIANANVTADKLSTGASNAIVATNQSTTSTSFTDLTTVGPTVTVTIGANGLALVTLFAYLSNGTVNANTIMGFDISGATTVSAAAALSVQRRASDGNVAGFGTNSATFLLTGLTAGSTTFKARYAVNAGTGHFTDRRIGVVPL